MSDFCNILKELRSGRQMTQDELSSKLGISKSTISMYENGNRKPDFETLETIADFFNVDMNYLLGRNSSKDDEVNEYLDELHKRPELKALFSVTKNAKKEDIEKAIKIIEMFKTEKNQ